MRLDCQDEHKYTGIPPNKHAVRSCGVISEADMFVYYLYISYTGTSTDICGCAHVHA